MASLFRTRTSFFHKRSSSSLSKSPHAATTDTAADPATEVDPCMICHVTVGVCTPDGETESWSVLPCGHRFGSHCIKRWLGLAEQPACPICRSPMTHVCGHPVLPLLIVLEMEAAGINSSNNNSYRDSKSSSRASKKTALVSQNASTIASPLKAGHGESGARRSLSRFRRKRRRNSAPPASSPVVDAAPATVQVPARTLPDTKSTCEYCSTSLVKHASLASPSPAVVRLAVRVFSSHTRNNSTPISSDQMNTENAYWERWRRDNGAAFGQWWATQQPPTEPAREMPAQGWVQ